MPGKKKEKKQKKQKNRAQHQKNRAQHRLQRSASDSNLSSMAGRRLRENLKQMKNLAKGTEDLSHQAANMASDARQLNVKLGIAEQETELEKAFNEAQQCVNTVLYQVQLKHQVQRKLKNQSPHPAHQNGHAQNALKIGEQILTSSKNKEIKSLNDALKKEQHITDSLKKSIKRHIAAFVYFLDNKNINEIIGSNQLKAFEDEYLTKQYLDVVKNNYMPRKIDELISKPAAANDCYNAKQPNTKKHKHGVDETTHKGSPTQEEPSEKTPLLGGQVKTVQERETHLKEYRTKGKKAEALKEEVSGKCSCCCFPFWRKRSSTKNNPNNTLGQPSAGLRSRV